MASDGGNERFLAVARVIADRVDRNDLDVPFARNGLLLGSGMALNFGAWGFDAEIFGRKVELFTAVETDCQRRA